MLPLASRLVAEPQLLDVQPVPRLGDLGRTVERIAVEAAEHRAVAVPRRRAAPAADLRLHDREVPARVRMFAADERAADRGEAAGRQPVAEVRRQTAPHHVVQSDLDLVVSRERGRRARVEDRTGPREQSERPEVPRVRGRVRPCDVHEDHLRRDLGPVARGVVRPGILVRVVAQVDDELVVADVERDAVDDAAVLLLLEAEPPLRQLLKRPPRDLLAVVHEYAERVLERLQPVLVDEIDDATLPDARGGDPGPHVALQEVRLPAVHLHDLHHRLDRLPFGDQLDRRQPQPLLEDLLRLVRDGAGHHPSDVVPVRDIGRPRDALALGENRHRQHNVVQMRHAAVEGVVRGEDVAWADRVSLVQLDDPGHRLVEHADEGGNPCARGREVPLTVRDPRAHVEHLVDDRAHRGLAERREHLVADRLERALDDLQRDRIRGRLETCGRHRSPSSSVVASDKIRLP